MKIAVVSDTHDNLPKLKQFIQAVNEENVGLVIHCGDFVSPFTLRLLLSELHCEFFGVFGNNDGEVAGLLKVSGGLIEKPPAVKVVDGRRFVVLHEPYLLDSLVKSQDFDYILYGHTHEVENRVVGSCRIVNPGELCGYLTGRSSFAILDTRENSVEVREL